MDFIFNLKTETAVKDRRRRAEKFLYFTDKTFPGRQSSICLPSARSATNSYLARANLSIQAAKRGEGRNFRAIFPYSRHRRTRQS